MRPEYRIRTKWDRPAPESYASFHEYPTAPISDAFRKRQTLPANVKPLYPGCPKVVGPALTVQVTPGDELLALKAIELAQPGDVVVVSGARNERSSLWGGIMSTMAKTRGIAGLVTDGMVRDLDETREIAFPIYCTGHLPNAPVMDSPPGDLGYPIPFGNVIVEPGDLVVADEDGVVVVPRADIAAVDVAIQIRLKKEADWKVRIADTKQMILKDNVDALLARRTVEEE